jgi:hypothetical protein
MRNYSKIGGKPGRPGYRTPSGFQSRKNIKNNLAKKDKISKKAYGKNL